MWCLLLVGVEIHFTYYGIFYRHLWGVGIDISLEFVCMGRIFVFKLPEQESSEEHPAGLHPPAGLGAPPLHCSQQHPQTRALSVQQSKLIPRSPNVPLIPRSKVICLWSLMCLATIWRCCPMTAKLAACLSPTGGWRGCRRSKQILALFCRSTSTI